jgi:hypothetical protein
MYSKAIPDLKLPRNYAHDTIAPDKHDLIGATMLPYNSGP